MVVWVWMGFVVFVLAMLALDLGVLNRRAHAVSVRQALLFTGFTVVLALGFSVAVYFMYQHDWLGIATSSLGEGDARLPARDAALQFLTGWIIEYSLSLDNIFVIALIFQYFRVPLAYQHRVLFWGILGALIMRGVMIGLGAALVHRFEWIMYVFGGILILTALKMLFSKEADVHPDSNWAVRIARRLFTVSRDYDGHHFWTRIDGRLAVTPLFLVLLVVETTDVIFAVDSIPAIFGITQDPFLVFTSNVFAILGLRSLYFALAAILGLFRHLKYSLVLVLFFVGVKMILDVAGVYHTPTIVSLGVIGVLLAGGVVSSLLVRRPEPTVTAPSIAGDLRAERDESA